MPAPMSAFIFFCLASLYNIPSFSNNIVWDFHIYPDEIQKIWINTKTRLTYRKLTCIVMYGSFIII